MSYDESESHDDAYSGMRPLVEVSSNNDSFHCTLTLKQIQKELKKLTDMAHKGIDIDEARFDYLLRAQEHNEEYKLWLAEEKATWRESVYEFAEQCLERTRTFVPVNVFESSVDQLIELGLTPELAKRILQRQCLWLVRMSKAEIASLHESDLLGRYNSSAQLMDIIETAAIYIALPEKFNSDEQGRKSEWRDRVEESLRRMLQDNDDGKLSDGRLRNPAYDGLQFGPVEDVTSVRATNIVSGRHSHRPRRSFMEVCKAHSILSAVKVEEEDPAPDSSDSEVEGPGKFQDEYEDDAAEEEEEGEADEEVYAVNDEANLKFGSSSSLLQQQPQVQRATSYASRDFLDESFYEQDEEDEEELERIDEAGAEEGWEDNAESSENQTDVVDPTEKHNGEDVEATNEETDETVENGDTEFEHQLNQEVTDERLEQQEEDREGDAQVVDDAIIDQLAQLEAEAVAEIAAALEARSAKDPKDKDSEYCMVDRADGSVTEQPDQEAVEVSADFGYEGDDLSSSSSEEENDDENDVEGEEGAEEGEQDVAEDGEHTQTAEEEQ